MTVVSLVPQRSRVEDGALGHSSELQYLRNPRSVLYHDPSLPSVLLSHRLVHCAALPDTVPLF